MLSSLRSRLLLSYLAIIAVVLSIVGLALLALSLSQSGRILPTLRQLAAVSQGVRRELAQLAEPGAPGLLPVARLLDEAAADQEVRILLVNKENGRVLYDSDGDGGGWTRLRILDVVRPAGEFLNVDPSLPVGRYRDQDDLRWLVYSQQLTARGVVPLLLVVGRPEPAPLQYFRETYLRPLFVGGLLALLAALFLAFIISRSVARPLQGMAGASESIAQGQYEQQLPLEGPEEVQRLAGSFNRMARQVSDTQQAQRDFVTNVSHDLKTPLTSIRGWSQALLDGTAQSEEERREAVSIIQGEAERMERMVDQLLDLARLESGQMQLAREMVDLGRLLSEVEGGFSLRAAEKQVDLSLEIQPVPLVTGDHDRLVQAVSNLVDNALAYTPQNGRVQLILRPYGADQVEITVRDSGTGIPAAELGRVFERFYRVDKSRDSEAGSRGSGIGLAIVKELVEAHGGQVLASSRVGQGSTFTIRLPLENMDSNNA